MVGITTYGTAALAAAGTAFGRKYAVAENYDHTNFYDKFDFITKPASAKGHTDLRSLPNALDLGITNLRNGEIYLGVDHNTTLPDAPEMHPYAGSSGLGGGRTSFRVESKAAYKKGLIVARFSHIPPAVCGSRPGFLTLGQSGKWPNTGEINMLQGWNDSPTNKPSIHVGKESKFGKCVLDGYDQAAFPSSATNCDNSYFDPPRQWRNQGCISEEVSNGIWNSPDGGIRMIPIVRPQASYEEWLTMMTEALEWNEDFIKIYSWPFTLAPKNIDQDEPDTSSWGSPSVHLKKSHCDIESHFGEQKMVFYLSFCGSPTGENFFWDDFPGKDAVSCKVKTGESTCIDYVNRHPEAFKESYFKIKDIRYFEEKEVTSSSSTSMVSTPSSSIPSSSATLPSTNSSSIATTSDPLGPTIDLPAMVTPTTTATSDPLGPTIDLPAVVTPSTTATSDPLGPTIDLPAMVPPSNASSSITSPSTASPPTTSPDESLPFEFSGNFNPETKTPESKDGSTPGSTKDEDEPLPFEFSGNFNPEAKTPESKDGSTPGSTEDEDEPLPFEFSGNFNPEAKTPESKDRSTPGSTKDEDEPLPFKFSGNFDPVVTIPDSGYEVPSSSAEPSVTPESASSSSSTVGPSETTDSFNPEVTMTEFTAEPSETTASLSPEVTITESMDGGIPSSTAEPLETTESSASSSSTIALSETSSSFGPEVTISESMGESIPSSTAEPSATPEDAASSSSTVEPTRQVKGTHYSSGFKPTGSVSGSVSSSAVQTGRYTNGTTTSGNSHGAFTSGITPAPVPMTASTVYKTDVYVVTDCPKTVTKCPANGYTTTVIMALYTTLCPVSPVDVPTPVSPVSPSAKTATAKISKVYTITKCPPSVPNCPIGRVVTENCPGCAAATPSAHPEPAPFNVHVGPELPSNDNNHHVPADKNDNVVDKGDFTDTEIDDDDFPPQDGTVAPPPPASCDGVGCRSNGNDSVPVEACSGKSCRPNIVSGAGQVAVNAVLALVGAAVVMLL
ncbi:hypothetical protein RJ55_05016 [Drechmeria coniospora]|nr:hypothetical protein RJ55_05016 [Drechmeria coniospora]